MIELPSTFAESGAYPPDRAPPGPPRQCSLPLTCRHTSRRASNWNSEEARTWEHHPQPTIPPPRLNQQAESRKQPVGCSSRVSPALLSPERPFHTFTLKPGFGGRGHERGRITNFAKGSLGDMRRNTIFFTSGGLRGLFQFRLTIPTQPDQYR